jgi:hypothetical protein
MPRVRKQSKRRRTTWGHWHVEQLLTGMPFFPEECFGSDCGLDGDVDWAEMQRAWESLRDTLLPQWIRERPGSRPYAWWCFDAPERRRRIDGKPHPFDRPGRTDKRLSFGRPRAIFVEDAGAEYETERAYLERLDLLTAAEKKVLLDEQAQD